jgi:hypothetical protein
MFVVTTGSMIIVERGTVLAKVSIGRETVIAGKPSGSGG